MTKIVLGMIAWITSVYLIAWFDRFLDPYVWWSWPTMLMSALVMGIALIFTVISFVRYLDRKDGMQ